MNDVGATHTFVLSKGFAQVGNPLALIVVKMMPGSCLPDRPDMRPQEAYKSILSWIQPGQDVAVTPIILVQHGTEVGVPEAGSRMEDRVTEGSDILHPGLSLAVQEYPLPFVRRTVLGLFYRAMRELPDGRG